VLYIGIHPRKDPISVASGKSHYRQRFRFRVRHSPASQFDIYIVTALAMDDLLTKVVAASFAGKNEKVSKDQKGAISA
jgi:hypothetical protein